MQKWRQCVSIDKYLPIMRIYMDRHLYMYIQGMHTMKKTYLGDVSQVEEGGERSRNRERVTSHPVNMLWIWNWKLNDKLLAPFEVLASIQLEEPIELLVRQCRTLKPAKKQKIAILKFCRSQD